MSSTPARRTGRPIGGTSVRIPKAPRAEATTPESRAYASPLERAFPIPRITVDTLAVGGIVLLALILRVVMLGDRPLHHDESLHATYSWYLMGRANPEYHYDPMMHGPLQFHMIAFFYSIFTSSPFAARLWSATAGTALVAVPWLLRRQLGRWPTYALMAILCVSPVTLYFSRFAREDMQVGLFTFLMVAAILRYTLDRRDGYAFHYRWLYVLSASFILAYAGKENIYLTVAILGAFICGQLALELLRGAWWVGPAVGICLAGAGVLGHMLPIAALGALIIVGVLVVQLWVSEENGLLADAIRSTPWKAWGFSAAIIASLFVLLYWPIGDPASWGFKPGDNVVHTTFEENGVSKPATYSTDGFLGGLSYWNSQQGVARGSQPWYYYLLVIPLYEWLVVLFGIVGGIYVLLRKRTMTTMLVLWWTISSFLAYGWASEKMPWLTLHMVIPLAILAAIGLVVSVTHTTRWVRYLAIAAAVITGFVSTHNAVTLAYVNGANPVEYLVYVQTSPDVPAVYNELQRIQPHLNGPLHLMVDNDDTWPWAFYLRNPGQWAVDSYPSTPSAFGVPTQPVVFVSAANYPALSTTLASRYVSFHENLRWWNPEEYRTYAERTDTNGKLLPITSRIGHFLSDALSPSTWSNIMRWEIGRRPFSPHAWDNYGNQLDFYFAVRKDLVPYLSPKLQQQAQAQIKAQALLDPFLTHMRTIKATTVYGNGGAAGAAFSSAGPLAVDAQGRVLVGDLTAHRIVMLAANGSLLRSWGSAGTGPGQFNGQYAPGIGGIAVGPNGHIYATDTWNQRVEEFTASGTFVRAWGKGNLSQDNLKPSEFYGPRGIAVAPNGNVYVADTGHKRIQVFSATGTFLFTFGGAGALPGQFNEPSSMAIDTQGRIYVADYWNHRVQVLDAHGRSLSQFDVSAWQAGSYDEPQIAVDSAGRVYVPDPSGSRVLVYNSATGKPAFAWGGIGSGLGQFNKPLAVVTGPGGGVYVTDSGNTRVLRFTAP